MSKEYAPKPAEYMKPRTIRIGRTPNTERLYALEHKAHEAFRKAAIEAAILRQESPGLFYTTTLPQALFDFLGDWDNNAAILACEAYLEMMTAKKGA